MMGTPPGGSNPGFRGRLGSDGLQLQKAVEHMAVTGTVSSRAVRESYGSIAL